MQRAKRDYLGRICAAVIAVMLCLTAGCKATGALRASDRKPNIIYILADDLGYGDLGCYGQSKIQTPNIDRMASEGMMFTNHYAGSTVCAPSRCVLMTGLHTGHARIRGNVRVPLEPKDRTVAEVLKGAGYKTALIGKWGLGEPGTTGIPTRQGFDYFFGYLNQRHAHNYYPEFLWRNEEKIQLPNKVDYKNPNSLGGVSSNKAVYSHDLFVQEAFAFIEKNQNSPFFLYLALTIPHANNEAQAKGMEVPELDSYEDKDWPDAQKGHAAMIGRMDRDIARLFELLQKLGIDDNTMVIFTSDNGPHREGGNDPDFADSNGVLRGIKRDLYEGGIRVPMIARWPGIIEAGARTDHISGFQDFLPTCADLTQVDVPSDLDGISYLPTLLGRPGDQRTHPYLYWEFHEQGGKQAVRMGHWKGIRLNVKKNPGGAIELYDLDKDLAEENNIAESHPEMVERMTLIMKEARTHNEAFPF